MASVDSWPLLLACLQGCQELQMPLLAQVELKLDQCYSSKQVYSFNQRSMTNRSKVWLSLSVGTKSFFLSCIAALAFASRSCSTQRCPGNKITVTVPLVLPESPKFDFAESSSFVLLQVCTSTDFPFSNMNRHYLDRKREAK